MPSDAVLRSLRRWLQVVAGLLGLCLVALVAGLAVLRDLAPDPPDDVDRET